MRVLIVEDDADLAEGVARWLRRKAIAVDIAEDGASGLEKALVNDYDVVILDRDLPVVHGDDVAQQLIGAETSPRILMLTASGTLDDKIAGLSIGADDYLAKPFAMAELEARVRALARRPGTATPPVLTIGEITVDPAAFGAERAGNQLKLTRKEFMVLKTLMERSPSVVSAEELLEKVWDEHADPFTNAPRITVMTLRRKLGEPDPIETVVGVGYRLV